MRFPRATRQRRKDGANSIDDLSTCFGADPCHKEVDFLVDTEWALSTDDIIWRRTTLGLRSTKAEVENLTAYLSAEEEAVESRGSHG